MIREQSELNVYEIQRRAVCSSILTKPIVCVCQYFEARFALGFHLAASTVFTVDTTKGFEKSR